MRAAEALRAYAAAEFPDTEAIHLDVMSEDEFESEAAAHGLVARERIPIPATADHVGSTVCVFEVTR